MTGIISEHTSEAVIYKIRDEQQQEFALKLYFEFPNPKEELNPEALRRIQKIKDPDILRLYDFGTGTSKYQGKYCFEVCDFAQGGNLLVRQDYSTEFLKETIIPQIFKGIRTLHEQHIYHCDLKPENIFWLDAEQTDLVIGDYGSAKTFEETSGKRLTHTSTTKGTNFYLAPEQPRGVVSEKNDYYSFGMILLHLLYPQDVTRESLHRIIERQSQRKPIIDYDSRYGDLNDLIAGLTLWDFSTRWGETQVRGWLNGERFPVIYTTDAEVHPIKLGSTTIRTKSELCDYIEKNDDWYENLIEDQEGYSHLLRWLGDVQDLECKKVFDKMVRHYQQDGKNFLKEASLRYLMPERPVQIDMKEYDFWNAQNLEDTVIQYFQHLSKIYHITKIKKLKFHIFQFEFALRQVEKFSKEQEKLIATSILDKVAVALNLPPKANFDDYVCRFYHNLPTSKKNFDLEMLFPVILYSLDHAEDINSILGKLNQELKELTPQFKSSEESFNSFNNEYSQNQTLIQTTTKSFNSSFKISYFLTGILCMVGQFLFVFNDEPKLDFEAIATIIAGSFL